MSEMEIAQAKIGSRRARVRDTASEKVNLVWRGGDVDLGPVGVVDDLPSAGAEEREEAGEWDGDVRGVRCELHGEGDGAGAVVGTVGVDVVVDPVLPTRNFDR